MLKYFAPFLCLMLSTIFNPCVGQIIDESAEDFVNRYIGIVDSGNASRFLPDLVVSKAEFMVFLEEEWRQKLSKARRKKMQDELYQAAEKGWVTLNRKNGSWISNGLFNERQEFDPIMKTLRYYDIGINEEEDVKKIFAQLSSTQVTIISAKYILEDYPEWKHEIFFPCVRTAEGTWKMIYKIHMRRI